MNTVNNSRRAFIKRSSKLLVCAYAYVGLTLYSSKAFAFIPNIFDEVIKYVAQYFGMNWINDMKAGFDKITEMVEGLYGVSGGGKGGDDDANIKKIVGISRSNDALNTVSETIYNIEVATETQPAAIDACLIAGNRKMLHGVQSGLSTTADTKTVANKAYSPQPMPLAMQLADAGALASGSLNRTQDTPPKISEVIKSNYFKTYDPLSDEKGIIPAWMNVSKYLTDSGYYGPSGNNSEWTSDAEQFLKYLTSDSGIVPDADYVLEQFKVTEDIRLGEMIADITHVVAARSTVETALERIKSVRVRRSDLFNIYVNGEKEYILEIAKSHSKSDSQSQLMSVLDCLNADVERFAQSDMFLRDVIKSEALTPEEKARAKQEGRIIEELAVGQTPLLITASAIISAQQKWQLDLYEQNEMIGKLQSIMGLLDQLISNSEVEQKTELAINLHDPLYNFASSGITTEFLS